MKYEQGAATARVTGPVPASAERPSSEWIASKPPANRAMDVQGEVAISVVIPVFNEAGNIATLVDELAAAMASQPRAFEAIFVDDGSTDETPAILRRLASERPWLRVVFFRRNFGQTAAFDAGFRAAAGRIVVTLDGDLQNDPRDIPAMIDKLEEGYDVVAGWRWARRDGLLLRKVPSRMANWLIRRCTRTPIHDLGCSLRVYRREVTDELRLYGEMHRFISVLAHSMGARMAEVRVNHRPRLAGVSKYGLARTAKVALDLMTVLFLRRYRTKPIYVFGGLGILMMTIASSIAAYVLWEKLHEGIWVHRNPLFLIAVMAALVSVQLLGTGLIAELLIRTNDETQGKRSYSIAGRTGFETR